MNAHETPLKAEHAALGAHFTDFAGWQMPLRYGSELAEHRAVRESAGLFDLSHMGEIAVSGPQAGAVLDATVVGQPSTMKPGRARYSLLCNDDGGILDDFVIYRRGSDDFLVVANAANTAVVCDALVRCAKGSEGSEGSETTIADRTAEIALVAIQGPDANEIVRSLVGPDVDFAGLKYFWATDATVAGVDVLLSRTGYTGEDGFELYLPNAQAVALWRALLEATRARGGLPVGLAARDSLRLEAGLALYGHELTEDTNPYEAGLGRIVRLGDQDAGNDFPGRDALVRVSQDEARRVLVGLAGSGRRSARAGYAVFPADADAESNDAAVGEVTSGAPSPTLGHPIALAYVDAELAEPGTPLTVDIRGKREAFTVTQPPFYRRG
ncbi:MAG: glycine cleavage system aminomethyltransferase GcvT [Tomitella sp.]|nr:glycine cleavage system aminomethyltransferase GcvT [Tomitella sp.]